MRDPERIEPFLARLGELWKQFPDYRFGQLIMNISRVPGGFADTWNWEDEEWDRRISAYTAEESEEAKDLLDQIEKTIHALRSDLGT